MRQELRTQLPISENVLWILSKGEYFLYFSRPLSAILEKLFLIIHVPNSEKMYSGINEK